MTDLTLWTLVYLQIAMGAFDTLYHHELTERLAWRPNAATELRLHAVRNGFYGAIFLTLAWSEPHGLLALALLLVLVVEIAITLWDFGGQMAEEILLSGQRVHPAKALATGFTFKHATLEAGLGAALGAPSAEVTNSAGIDLSSESAAVLRNACI